MIRIGRKRLAWLGMPVAMTVAVACSHERKPAEQARQTSPTFESEIPTSPPFESRLEPEQQGRAPYRNERQLCDAIARDTRVRLESIPSGVAIIMSPKGDSGEARALAHALALQAALAPASPNPARRRR